MAEKYDFRNRLKKKDGRKMAEEYYRINSRKETEKKWLKNKTEKYNLRKRWHSRKK